MMRIVPGDFADPQIIALLRSHLLRARAEIAPGSAQALDVTALQSADISFWTIWDDDVLLGCGALKRLSVDHGEVKRSNWSAARESAARCCGTSLRPPAHRRCHG